MMNRTNDTSLRLAAVLSTFTKNSSGFTGRRLLFRMAVRHPDWVSHKIR